jgi:hypothetical protein
MTVSSRHRCISISRAYFLASGSMLVTNGQLLHD